MIADRVWAIGAGALLVVASGMLFHKSFQLSALEKTHNATLLQHAKEREANTTAAIAAQRKYDDERDAERAKFDQAATDGARRMADASNAAARGAVERDRLRDTYAATVARSCPSGPTAAASTPSAAASSPADLLAHVQRRIDEAAGGIADFADIAHAAGRTCQQVN